MKENAPEKLYLYPYSSHPAGKRYLNLNKLSDHDIEYIHADAFIEKLECWMNENFYFHAGEFAEGILGQFDRTEDAIDDFRKYINGE